MNQEGWRRVYGVVLYVSVAVLALLVMYQQFALTAATHRIDTVTTQIRETQKSSRSLLDVINDCTKPEGKCYQRSLAQQAEQAGALNAATIAAAWCSLHHPNSTLHELTVCVGKRLDGKDHK